MEFHSLTCSESISAWKQSDEKRERERENTESERENQDERAQLLYRRENTKGESEHNWIV